MTPRAYWLTVSALCFAYVLWCIIAAMRHRRERREEAEHAALNRQAVERLRNGRRHHDIGI